MMAYRCLGIASCLALVTACGGSQSGPANAGQPIVAVANPYAGASMFIDPDFVKNVDATAAADPTDAALLKKVSGFSTGIWLDSIAKTAKIAGYLDEAKKQEAAEGKPVVTTFIVYDLPNRDCSAKASNGELSVDKDGEARYKSEYIDKIAEQFRAHPTQRIAVVLEPDSLGNIATNLDNPRCAASEKAYRSSIAYAVKRLYATNVAIYLDAAHGGWLGWDGNRVKIAQIYKDVLTEAGGPDLIRGFATNVSNYNVVDRGDDATKGGEGPCPDEITYVKKLAASLADVGIKDKGFIIDTARNGRGGLRKSQGSWCNIKGAGLGERPKASPAPMVDAYYWIKTPGESDGTADKASPRFDAMCVGPDAAPGAPEAGKWWTTYFVDLAKNANPPL